MICPRNRRRGEAHHRNKLTPWDVACIRLLLAEAVPKARIARAYGVDRVTVKRIDQGRTWAWLP